MKSPCMSYHLRHQGGNIIKARLSPGQTPGASPNTGLAPVSCTAMPEDDLLQGRFRRIAQENLQKFWARTGVGGVQVKV